jgi:hypothetical protein
MKNCINSLSDLLKSSLVIIGTLLLIVLFQVDGNSEQIDTLVLKLQWTCPIAISDMKLSDLDLDGIDEILYCTDSDSFRIGIADAVNQNISFQSQSFPGKALSVASGFRNEDQYPDIIVGGYIVGDSANTGFFQTFDGPGFAIIHNVDSIDNSVNTVGIFQLDSADENEIYIGTFWHHENYFYLPPLEIYDSFSEGHLISYEADSLFPADTVLVNRASQMESYDINGDNFSELILGGDYDYIHDSHGSHYQYTSVKVQIFYPESTAVIDLDSTYINPTYTYGLEHVSFDALAIGDFNSDRFVEILSTYRSSNYTLAVSCLSLDCRNAETGEIIWSETDTGSVDRITGLAICTLINKSNQVVCVAYQSGLIRYKSGIDGTDMGISDSLPRIDHFALGNLDQDSLLEICIASDDSLYVFEAPFIATGVADTPDQTHPIVFSLHQNYPNPFNSKTEIRFDTPKASLIELTIYNTLGQKIRSFREHYSPGSHTIDWDGRNTLGRDVASGIYLYRLTAGNYRETKKMLLLK